MRCEREALRKFTFLLRTKKVIAMEQLFRDDGGSEENK